MQQTDIINHRNMVASLIAILIPLLLTIAKFVVALVTGSIAILASAVDSLLDVMITGVNFFTIRAAAKPPDAEHRFGHGKFEAFASLLQAILIILSGGYLAFESIRRLLLPEPIAQESLGLMVMGGSMVVTFLLVIYLQRVFVNTRSLVIKAEIVNFRADILANLAVVIGLVAISVTEMMQIDAIISLGIALLILWSAGELLKESFEILTDHELPLQVRQEIIDIIEHSEQGRITGWHQLRTRRAGSQLHIDFRLKFDAEIGLKDAHAAGVTIEDRILEKFPMATVLIHFDTE